MKYKYHMPTKLLVGDNCIIENSTVFKEFGSKALIVTGARSAKINGSQEDVINALNNEGVEHVVYARVMSNPTVECAYEGAEVAKENDADFVIAIGGGSPIDAAKAIAILAKQDISREELLGGKYSSDILPIISVPTTAGTGTEATQYSILSDSVSQTKRALAHEGLFPKVSFLDAKYMLTLPLNTTINTAVDALTHAVEGMLSVKASTISDALAKESISMIIECFDKMLEAKETGSVSELDLDFRYKVLQAACLAGMVIAQTGTISVHAMGYSLTYFKNIDHGRANGLLLAEYLRFVESKDSKLSKKILDAMKLISVQECKLLMESLLGEKEEITTDEIYKFSNIAIQTGNIPNSKVVPKEVDLVEMYSCSF